MDYIELKNMRFEGLIGCLDFEKTQPQRFLVSIRMGFTSIPACETDDLSDTVNYADIFDIAKDVITGCRFNLIERCASEIADRVFAYDERIVELKVIVSKPDAPIDGDFETVQTEINRKR